MNDTLDRTLAALKREVSNLKPPARVDRGIAAAIARAARVSSDRERSPRRFARPYQLAGSLMVAASLLLFVWILRPPSSERDPHAGQAGSVPAATDFIPVVPLADIVGTRGAYVVSTQMPRTMLSDFGLPISPVRAAEPVQSELLVRGDGTVLAVRFLE
jgi:hypothetical protein